MVDVRFELTTNDPWSVDDAICEGISPLGYWQKVNQSPTQTKPYNNVQRTCLMYPAPSKVEFQPFNRSYSQLTFFNLLQNTNCLDLSHASLRGVSGLFLAKQ